MFSVTFTCFSNCLERNKTAGVKILLAPSTAWHEEAPLHLGAGQVDALEKQASPFFDPSIVQEPIHCLHDWSKLTRQYASCHLDDHIIPCCPQSIFLYPARPTLFVQGREFMSLKNLPLF
jgi:hypothetical protein